MKISAEGQDREIEEGIIDGQCRRRLRWRSAKREGKDKKERTGVGTWDGPL